jgi:hypothetical protein
MICNVHPAAPRDKSNDEGVNTPVSTVVTLASILVENYALITGNRKGVETRAFLNETSAPDVSVHPLYPLYATANA